MKRAIVVLVFVALAVALTAVVLVGLQSPRPPQTPVSVQASSPPAATVSPAPAATTTPLPPATAMPTPGPAHTPQPTIPTPVAPCKTPMPGAIAYTFRRGDSLPRLAQHAGVSLETLRAFNGLSADSKSDVGQRICFPPGSIPPNQWPQPTPRPYPSCTLAQPPGQAPVIHLGPSDRKRVALTFDIGFYPHIARKMVQRLAELDLRATFFIIGVSGEQDPGQIRAILAGGHELGNHSWSHTDMTRLTPAQIRTELHRTEDFVRQVAPGAAMKPFFRAPFDHLNATVAQTAREEGYYIVNWSADAMDWVPGITPDEVLLSLRWGLRPGAIIALHASSPATLDALPAIRDLLIAEGYEAVPLSTLLAPANSPSSQ